MKKILLFISGNDQILQKIFEDTKTDPKILSAEIVGVVSRFKNDNIILMAEKLQLPFFHFSDLKDEKNYQEVFKLSKADHAVFINWPLRRDCGLPEDKTINVSKSPLDLKQKQISWKLNFGIRGPIIVEIPIIVRPEDKKTTLSKRVLENQKYYLGLILNDIAQGRIFPLPKNEVGFKDSNFSKFGKRCQLFKSKWE
jgi:methionyl-tRNA formyltransferase